MGPIRNHLVRMNGKLLIQVNLGRLQKLIEIDPISPHLMNKLCEILAMHSPSGARHPNSES